MQNESIYRYQQVNRHFYALLSPAMRLSKCKVYTNVCEIRLTRAQMRIKPSHVHCRGHRKNQYVPCTHSLPPKKKKKARSLSFSPIYICHQRASKVSLTMHARTYQMCILQAKKFVCIDKNSSGLGVIMALLR